MAASPKRPAASQAETSTAKRSKKNAEPTKSEPSKKAPSAEMKLQQSLLQADKSLAKIFLQAMREKPEGVSQKQLVRQFWASRDHLLKSHAAALGQRRANYNVLSEVKPRNVEGAIKLNITPDQVEDIFRQHPVVRTAYNDTVPNKYRDNMSFWSSFFVSGLFKKLKGERITEGDQQNATLDRYINDEKETTNTSDGDSTMQQRISHFIDIEGNEQNHSQRKGNQPDYTMRPNASEKVPVLRTLNSMSEKIMAHVAPDGSSAQHAPVGLDEQTYNQLRLFDLQGETDNTQVCLKIRDQQQLQNRHGTDDTLVQIARTGKELQQVLTGVRTKLEAASQNQPGLNSMDLASAIGFAEDSDESDSDDDEENDDDDTTRPVVNSHKNGFDMAIKRADGQIQALLSRQTDTFTTVSDPSTRGDIPTVAKTLTMPVDVLQDLLLTHQTTNEFLNLFWHLILTSRAASTELPPLLGTLDKSLARMASAAKTQEEIRLARLAQLKRKAQEDQARLRRRVTVDETEAGPGRKEIERLLEPMVRAIGFAKDRFVEIVVSNGTKVTA